MLMFSGTAQDWLKANHAENDSEGESTASSESDAKELESLRESEEMFEVSDEATETGIPSERQFADSIHYMTHQKVKATKKWGHLEITDERLEQKYETAKASNYVYRDFYMETLEAWMDGDFSNAVAVHNIIWNERNGTIGKATGLMSPREEMEYRNERFD
ncbi:hypothetical protein GCM10027156_13070 [Salinicoccus sesuvii]